MAAQPPDPEIEKLLAELRSAEAYRRGAAAKLAGQTNRDDRVIAVLWTMVRTDKDKSVRQAAEKALVSLGIIVAASPAPAKPISRNAKIRDFLIGFVGWYAINGLIWLAVFGQPGFSARGGEGLFIGLFLWPANLLTLIVLAFKWRWGALGVLVAISVNLVIASILGATYNAFCFIPIFAQVPH